MKTEEEIKQEVTDLFEQPGFFDQDESEAAAWIHRIYSEWVKEMCNEAVKADRKMIISANPTCTRSLPKGGYGTFITDEIRDLPLPFPDKK